MSRPRLPLSPHTPAPPTGAPALMLTRVRTEAERRNDAIERAVGNLRLFGYSPRLISATLAFLNDCETEREVNTCASIVIGASGMVEARRRARQPEAAIPVDMTVVHTVEAVQS